MSKIDPSFIGFDVDGVFADTMSLFIDIARNDYNINHIRYEDITSYMLEECIDIDKDIIEDIIIKMLDGNYASELKIYPGAKEVITRLSKHKKPIIFITARPYIEHLYIWMLNVLPLKKSDIEIIATGSFEAKTDVLLKKNIKYFVEDRLETCFNIKEAGVNPILFKQPWNRRAHPFIEVETWLELESLIAF